MANTDRPRGMWPLRHLTGGVIRMNVYKVDASNGDLISLGDPVIQEADGFCARGADGGTFVGVCAGFHYFDAAGDGQYKDQIPATKTSFTKISMWVWDDPDIIFGIQADGNTVETDRFATFPITIGDGDTTRKLSICELDTTGGSGDELKIYDKIDTPNNAWGTNVDLEVLINDHSFKAVKAGV